MTKAETKNKLMEMWFKISKLKGTPETKKFLKGLKNQSVYLSSRHGTEKLANTYWKLALRKYKQVTGEEFNV